LAEPGGDVALDVLESKDGGAGNTDVSLVRSSNPSELVHTASSPFIAMLLLAFDHSQRLIRVAIITAVIAALLVLLIPNEYESTARLVPPDNPTANLLSGIAAKMGIGLETAAGTLKNTGSIFVPILKSRTVQDRVINRFDLRRVYRARYYFDARKRLAKNTALSEDRQTGVITLTVTDHNAERSANLCKAYIDELNRLAVELSASTAHRERIFLEDRLNAVKVELDAAARELSEFSSNNVALDIKEQGKAMMEGAAKLEGELIAAQSELKGLEQLYTDENTRVKAMRARVAQLQRSADELGGNAAKGYPGMRKLPGLGLRYAELYRRVKMQETVYDLLTQQYELAKLQEAKETPVIRVLDNADVPEKKSFPPRTLLILISVVLAVFATMARLYGAEEWARVGSDNPWKVLSNRINDAFKSSSERVWRHLGRA
jgi:uncharacterized protein involved in exopolysaccharide biosynthesis